MLVGLPQFLVTDPRCCCAAHRQISSCPECTAIGNCKFPFSGDLQKPGGWIHTGRWLQIFQHINIISYLPVCPMEWTNMKCFRETLVPSCSHPGLYMMNVHHKSKWSLWSLLQCAMAAMGPTGPCWGYSQQSRSQASNWVKRVLTPWTHRKHESLVER